MRKPSGRFADEGVTLRLLAANRPMILEKTVNQPRRGLGTGWGMQGLISPWTSETRMRANRGDSRGGDKRHTHGPQVV